MDGRPDADIDGLGIGNMRQLRQCHTAGIAADQNVHLVVSGQLLDRRDTLLRIFGFVGDDDLELASEQAALRVDFLNGHLGGVLRVASDLKLDRGRDALLGYGDRRDASCSEGDQARRREPER